MPNRSRLRKWLRRALITALLIPAVGAAGWFVAEQVLHRDELRRFHAVRTGMSEEEVLATIDMPPGQYGPAGAKYGNDLWLG